MRTKQIELKCKLDLCNYFSNKHNYYTIQKYNAMGSVHLKNRFWRIKQKNKGKNKDDGPEDNSEFTQSRPEDTGCNCRADYAGHIGGHGMHEQKVVGIFLLADHLYDTG